MTPIEIFLCASAIPAWCEPSQAQPDTTPAALYSSPCESPEMMLAEYQWFGGKWQGRDICWRMHKGVPLIVSAQGGKATPTTKPLRCAVAICTPRKEAP